MHVPVTGKIFSDDDKRILHSVIDSGEELTYGSYNEKFEKSVKEYVGTKYAFFVNSGSSANLLALAAFTSPHMYPKWRIRPGDEIITLAAGFPTTVAPIVQMGCVPVFVDIRRNDLNIDLTLIEKAITPKTRGIFVAHTLGIPFYADTVRQICDENNLFLIEDNCDGLGSTLNGRKTGTFGVVSTLSFYPAHHLTCAQGGMVLTSDDRIAKILRSIRGWGKSCSCPPNQDNVCGKRFEGQFGTLPVGFDHKYVFSEFGYNLQGTNILAALGYSQMQHIQEFTEQRIKNYSYLYCTINEMKLPITTVDTPLGTKPSWFGFPIILDKKYNVAHIMEELNKRGVQSRTLFAGNITRQPCFTDNKEIPYRIVGNLKNTDYIMNHMFWVGCWHGLNEQHMQYIAESLKEVLE